MSAIGGGSDAPRKACQLSRNACPMPASSPASRSMATPTPGGTRPKGRYARGHTPRVGAVMAFQPYGNSRLGHVAAVKQGDRFAHDPAQPRQLVADPAARPDRTTSHARRCLARQRLERGARLVRPDPGSGHDTWPVAASSTTKSLAPIKAVSRAQQRADRSPDAENLPTQLSACNDRCAGQVGSTGKTAIGEIIAGSY